MKNVTAILFLTIYLFTTTEVHQLLKLPVFFEHFQEHKKENRHISMLQFLAMHYLYGNPQDKDYERDMQLPFKSSGDCTATISTAHVPLMVTVSITRLIELPEKKTFITRDQFILSSYLSNIWQPPKPC